MTHGVAAWHGATTTTGPRLLQSTLTDQRRNSQKQSPRHREPPGQALPGPVLPAVAALGAGCRVPGAPCWVEAGTGSRGQETVE